MIARGGTPGARARQASRAPPRLRSVPRRPAGRPGRRGLPGRRRRSAGPCPGRWSVCRAPITFRTAAAAQSIAAIAARSRDCVGAGRSSTWPRPRRRWAGARFIVAPGFDPAVVDFARQRGVPIVPGMCTATEVGMALARAWRSSSCSPPRRPAASAISRRWPPRSAASVSCLAADRPRQSRGLSRGRAGGRLQELDGQEGSRRRRRVRHHPRARRPGARDRLRRTRRSRRRAAGSETMSSLKIRAADGCRWDLVALGEGMLRLDPARGRVATARFVRRLCGRRRVQRGARLAALLSVLRTALVSALADNPIGPSHRRARPARRGRPRVDVAGCPRRHGPGCARRTQLHRAWLWGCAAPSAVPTTATRPCRSCARRARLGYGLRRRGARWFHCGGIFAALGERTADVVTRPWPPPPARHDRLLRPELRPSLWRSIGGRSAPARSIAPWRRWST